MFMYKVVSLSVILFGLVGYLTFVKPSTSFNVELKNITRNQYAEFFKIKNITSTVVPVEKNIFSVVQVAKDREYKSYFVLNKPANISADCALIYHAGHSGALWDEDSNLIKLRNRVLQKGCVFVGMTMPLNGLNSTDRQLTALHDGLAALRSEEFEPFALFVNPVIQVLNYLEDQGIRKIAMAGFSGGGWTTTMAAALDERIIWSRSIAGAAPFVFAFIDKSSIENEKDVIVSSVFGDFEQSDTYFWVRKATYWDMYKLSSSNGRSAKLLFFQNDDCCFPGGIVPIMNKVFQARGINVRAFNDKVTKSHVLSVSAIEWIMEDIFSDQKK